jgi:hypothetical protein
MTLGPRDRDRLMRMEAELADSDPALVARFRRAFAWKHAPVRPDWCVAPPWTLMVFLVGFTTWVVSPVVGTVVAAVWLGVVLRNRLLVRVQRGQGPGGGRRQPVRGG